MMSKWTAQPLRCTICGASHGDQDVCGRGLWLDPAAGTAGRVCHQCHAVETATARFCSRCGVSLAAAPHPVGPHTQGTSRGRSAPTGAGRAGTSATTPSTHDQTLRAARGGVLAAGGLMVLSAFLPWSAAKFSLFGLFPGVATTSTSGWGSGPTAVLAVGLAALAAALAVIPSEALPRYRAVITRPAMATTLAAGAVVCVAVRAITIGNTGRLGEHASPRFGVYVALLAGLTQLSCALLAGRLTTEPLLPDFRLALDPYPRTTGRVPRAVHLSAGISLLEGALCALGAFIFLLIAAGLSSVSLLAPFGRMAAVVAVLPVALAAWFIVLTLQLRAGRRWARTAQLLTHGATAVLFALATLGSNDDPTGGLLAVALSATAALAVCGRSTRVHRWS